MLFGPGVGFDQALSLLVAPFIGKLPTYPGIVELGLNTDVVAFFLVLGAEDLEFRWFQRARWVSFVDQIRGKHTSQHRRHLQELARSGIAERRLTRKVGAHVGRV